MNYRHAYHAGNFADVLKHTVLLALLESLQAKPTPFCYLDTHAGSGSYALDSVEAGKTHEYLGGIARLLGVDGLPPLLARYRDLVLAGADTATPLRHYPGSPLFAARLLRPDDQAQLCELHPEEAAALRALLAHDKRMHVHQRDGYAALKALLPPAQKRGLVLIDPPYELQEAEYATIDKALKAALQRWPNGIYAVWYPVKLRSQVQPFLRAIGQLPVKRVLRAEILVHAANTPLRLNGAGMVVLNAPWDLDQRLRAAMTTLAPLLAQGDAAPWQLDWLRSDAPTPPRHQGPRTAPRQR
ncbi:MAG: 23S rRNA (adenine(2030)-N(6))-methyltransferase RlmJ [Xanthomonadales bacterium]|nr:23S rRNA (adenine(2030)-N(6))-methyltransferase RlmJ [Xanthomonadales bacterium]